MVIVTANINANDLLPGSEQEFDASGAPELKAREVNHPGTPPRQLHVSPRASSCAKRGGHVNLCLKARGRAEPNPRPSEEGSASVLAGVDSGAAVEHLWWNECRAFSRLPTTAHAITQTKYSFSAVSARAAVH